MTTMTKMKPTYKIFIVDDDKFDDLHKDLKYMTKEKLKDSLGFANPKTNEAYVRRTGVKEIDDATMEHELQELLVKISPDEIDGIRYKKGGILRFIAPILLGAINPILGAISGAGMGAFAAKRHPEQLGSPVKAGLLGGLSGALGGSALKTGITGARAGAAVAKQAGKGFLGRIGAGVKGALVGTPAVAGIAAGGAGVGAAPAGVSTFIPAVKGVLGTGGALIGGGTAASKAAQATQLGTTPATGFAATALAPTTKLTTAPTTLTSKISNFASKPSNVLGTALSAGSLLPKTPQFEFPEQFTDLQSKLLQGGGISPLGQQARTELSSILSATPSELHPEANQQFLDATFRKLDEQFIRDKEALDARYNVAGVLGGGEHLAAVDELEQNYTNLKNDTTAQINQRNFELGRTEKYQAIQDSLGVDKADMDALLGLTGYSTEVAAQIYNVKASDVEELRKAMGTLGSELLLRGSGLQQSAGITINTGGGLLGGV